jgi:hypothetical protein
MLFHPSFPAQVFCDWISFHPIIHILPKEKNLKFPKQLSFIFLILFLLSFGIYHFVLSDLLSLASAVFAIVAAICTLLGK